MNKLCIKISNKLVDNCIAFAIAIQSPLILLQQVLIDILGMNAEETTKYRVLLTAMPMSLAIILGFNRNKKLFVYTYFFIFILLLYNIVLFPQNQEFLFSEVIRFTLPVVIPSCLCFLCLSNIYIFEKVLYYVSWLTFVMAVYYVLNLIGGKVMFGGYNMSFSYGLLLPMMALYSHKTRYSVFASLLLLLFVIALGSRGAAVAFFLYIILDIFLFNKKYVPLIIAIIIFAISLIPLFLNYLDDIGISSRTLMLLLNGDFEHDSGRSEVYELVIIPLMENPLMGLGLWGDRYYIDGSYCHNIILEICLNFGLILGPLLILYFVIQFLVIYYHLYKEYRMLLLKYLLACILPLLFSNSYLISPNFGIFIGIFMSIRMTLVERKI